LAKLEATVLGESSFLTFSLTFYPYFTSISMINKTSVAGA